MNVEWKNIGSLHYEVNTCGIIRNSKTGNLVKARLNKKHGYESVILTDKGIQKTYYVHRLVAQAFITKRPNTNQVNHIDGNKRNNSKENLEWCTPKENINHAFSNGLIKRDGIKNSQHKLNEIDVISIRKKHLEGDSVSSLSSLFKCGQTTVRSIVKRKSWINI
jgi:HNH endonuclease